MVSITHGLGWADGLCVLLSVLDSVDVQRRMTLPHFAAEDAVISILPRPVLQTFSRRVFAIGAFEWNCIRIAQDLSQLATLSIRIHELPEQVEPANRKLRSIRVVRRFNADF